MRSGSRHLRPNWPKFSSKPPLAAPWMRPLNCLRNLVFLGCSMAASHHSPDGSRLRVGVIAAATATTVVAVPLAAPAGTAALFLRLLILSHGIVLEDLALEHPHLDAAGAVGGEGGGGAVVHV